MEDVLRGRGKADKVSGLTLQAAGSTGWPKRLKAARVELQAVVAVSLIDQVRYVFGGLGDCGHLWMHYSPSAAY